MTLSTEILFDRFEIIEILKKDEHASVFLANHIYLSKKIILKILNTEKIADNSLVERFKREAKILARLDHPNIIKVLDFGTSKEYFYISFEYFEGESLRNLLKKNNLTTEQKEMLMAQLLKGLDYAHSYKIIHRDIKPENIFVNASFQLKIGDFGLALSAEDNLVTQPYSIVGTPGYMSPEQIRGEKLTDKSDLFSAGVVLFEMYTGKNPFLQENINLTINKIMSFNEDEIKEDLEIIPDEQREIISGLLRRNPSQRFQSAAEILKKLNITNETQYYKTQTITTVKSKKNAVIAVFSSAVVISAIVLVMFIQRNNSSSKNETLTGMENAPTAETQKEPIKHEFGTNEHGSPQENALKTKEQTSLSGKTSDNQKENITPANNSLQSLDNETNADKVIPITPPAITKNGRLFIDCYPWAEVYIDGVKKDVTPLSRPITLQPGDHTLKLINPDYPPYMALIRIEPNQRTDIKINLDKTLTYLKCNVYPWGNIYVNGEFKGQTPLRELVKLNPGENRITIKNPNYRDIDTLVTAAKGDTLNLVFKFKK